MIEIGQRVRVKTLDTYGTVEYIEYRYLFQNHMYPVQLKLEERYYDVEQPNAYMYRCGLDELEIKTKTDSVSKQVSIKD